MSETNSTPAPGPAKLDTSDLAAVRTAVEQARAIGHWRRLLSIFGAHLPGCETLAHPDDGRMAGMYCNCGFVDAFSS